MHTAAGTKSSVWPRRAAALLLLALLLFLARTLEWRQFLATLADARLPWIAIALVLHAFVLVLWAGLWRCFVPADVGVRFRTLLGAATLSGAAMLVTPSLAGQASAAALLVRRARLSIGSSALVLAAEQVCEAAAKAVVLILALIFAPLPAEARGWTLLVAVLFGGVVGVAVLAGRWWQRAPEVLRSKRRTAGGMALALGIKAVEAAVLVAVQLSLGVQLGAGAILLLLAIAAVGLIAASLVPVPGPVGVSEAAVVVGYTQLGLTLEVAVALVAVHTATLALTRVGGAVAVLLADAVRPHESRAAA